MLIGSIRDKNAYEQFAESGLKPGSRRLRNGHKKPGTQEHLIPVVRFARMGRMTLETKQRLANAHLNVFGAHRFCNTARHDMPLTEWYAKRPDYEFVVRQAFSNMMTYRNVQGADVPMAKRLPREAGWLLSNDLKKLFRIGGLTARRIHERLLS